MTDAPTGSNADEWALFLSEWGTAYCAVRIAEALEAAEKRGYARGIEVAANCADHLVGFDAKTEGAMDAGEGFDLACDTIAKAIRALAPSTKGDSDD